MTKEVVVLRFLNANCEENFEGDISISSNERRKRSGVETCLLKRSLNVSARTVGPWRAPSAARKCRKHLGPWCWAFLAFFGPPLARGVSASRYVGSQGPSRSKL